MSPIPYQFGIYTMVASPFFFVSSPFNSWYYKLIEWKYFKQLKLMMFGIKCPNLGKNLAFKSQENHSISNHGNGGKYQPLRE